MEVNLTCPKCNGTMDEGFIVDQSEGYYVSKWHPGLPEDVRLFGIKMGTVSVNMQLLRPVATYRCAQCGFLESYAP